MNRKAPHHILFAILGIVALFLVSCGGNEDLAKKLNCPSGSILANSDDTIVRDTAEPTAVKFSLGPTVGGTLVAAGPPALYTHQFLTPLKFSVWAPVGGARKNNICIVLTTDGFIYDFPGGTNQGQFFVTKTDGSGSVTVWFSSEALVSSASASGTTAGADVTGADVVTAYSGGAQQAYWNYAYTVEGCAVGAPCP